MIMTWSAQQQKKLKIYKEGRYIRDRSIVKDVVISFLWMLKGTVHKMLIISG